MLRRLRGALVPPDFGANEGHSALIATEAVKPTVRQHSGARGEPVMLDCCCDTNGGGFIANRTIGA
jgi:hypothetical protein